MPQLSGRQKETENLLLARLTQPLQPSPTPPARCCGGERLAFGVVVLSSSTGVLGVPVPPGQAGMGTGPRGDGELGK